MNEFVNLISNNNTHNGNITNECTLLFGSYEVRTIISFSSIMLVTYLYSAILILNQLITTFIQRYSSSNLLIFYFFLIFYALGKGLYFGYITILSTFTDSLSFHSIHFPIDDKGEDILAFILYYFGYAIFQWSSTFFYDSFFFLALHGAELIFRSYGMGFQYIKRTLKYIYYVVYVIVFLSQAFQIILTLTAIILGFLFRNERSGLYRFEDIVKVIQVTFHFLLAGFSIVFWIFYLIFAFVQSRKQKNLSQKAVFPILKKSFQLIFLICSLFLICMIFKGLENFVELFLGFLCYSSRIIVLFFVCVFDLTPLLIVIFLLSRKHLRKSTNIDEKNNEKEISQVTEVDESSNFNARALIPDLKSYSGNDQYKIPESDEDSS